MNEPTAALDPIVMEVRLNQWTGRSSVGAFAIDLQRDDHGNLTAECLTELGESIQQLKPSAEASPPCLCLLSGSGVSLRTLEIPPIKGGSIHNLVELQIESEWPLPPEELVWGYAPWESKHQSGASSDPIVVTLAAIKKTLFLQYDERVRSCGLEPTWTLSAFIGGLVDEVSPSQAIWLLEVRDTSAELIEFESGHAKSVRQIANPTDEAPLPSDWFVEALPAELLNDQDSRPIILATHEPSLAPCMEQLERRLPAHTIHPCGIPNQPELSLATHLLRTRYDGLPSLSHVILQTDHKPDKKSSFDRKLLFRWAALMILLILAILLARRIEPALKGDSLRRQLATFETEKKRLPEIDRELGFLSHLHERNLPFQDLISLLAANTGSGFEIRSLEMSSDRRIQIQGSLPERSQPEDLRTKLSQTGWFEQVVLDEQTPNKQERNLTVRVSLTLKPVGGRSKLTREQLGLPKLAQKSE